MASLTLWERRPLDSLKTLDKCRQVGEEIAVVADWLVIIWWLVIISTCFHSAGIISVGVILHLLLFRFLLL